MQNKPNLLDARMNVSSVKTMNYEQITMNNANKNKPNTNPTCRGVASGEAGSNPKHPYLRDRAAKTYSKTTHFLRFLLKKHAFLQISYHFLRIFTNFLPNFSCLFYPNHTILS